MNQMMFVFAALAAMVLAGCASPLARRLTAAETSTPTNSERAAWRVACRDEVQQRLHNDWTTWAPGFNPG
jgi:hypothetical protein